MVKHILDSATESVTCMTLALRDGIKPPISLISAMIWVLAIAVWGIIFFLLHWNLVGLLPAFTTLSPFFKTALQDILLIALYLAVVVITVRIAIEFWLMKRIQRACLVHYPQLKHLYKGSLVIQTRDAIKSGSAFAVGGLICLLIPVIGPALLFTLFGYLNVRSLVNDALDGLVTNEERRQIIEGNRLTMTLIGAMIEGLMLVPIVDLFVPSILGAAVCHLSMRQAKKMRSQ
jgi:hypothetical protein